MRSRAISEIDKRGNFMGSCALGRLGHLGISGRVPSCSGGAHVPALSRIFSLLGGARVAVGVRLGGNVMRCGGLRGGMLTLIRRCSVLSEV